MSDVQSAMEKRNVIEEGRTPGDPAKMAAVVDESVGKFDIKLLRKETEDAKPADKPA